MVNLLADHHGDVIRQKLADMIPCTPLCLRGSVRIRV